MYDATIMGKHKGGYPDEYAFGNVYKDGKTVYEMDANGNDIIAKNPKKFTINNVLNQTEEEKENIKETYKFLYARHFKSLDISLQESYTEKEFKDIFDRANENRAEKNKLKFYTLSPEEKERRLAIQKKTSMAFAEYTARKELFSGLINSHAEKNNIDNDRVTGAIISAATSLEEFYINLKMAHSPHKEVRTEFVRNYFEKSVNIMKQLLKPMPEDKYIDFMNKNIAYVQTFAEWDGNKLQKFCENINVDFNEVKDIIKDYQAYGNTMSSHYFKMDKYVNPTYPVIDERNFFTLNEANVEEYDDLKFERSGHYDEKTDVYNDRSTHLMNQDTYMFGQFTKENNLIYRNFGENFYVSARAQGAVKFVTKNGEVELNSADKAEAAERIDAKITKEMAEQIQMNIKLGKLIDAGERIFAVDKDGKMVNLYRVSTTSDFKLLEADEEIPESQNFELNPKAAMKSFSTEFGKFNHWYLRMTNTPEFNDLIDGMEEFSSIDEPTDEDLKRIQQLAQAYIDKKDDQTFTKLNTSNVRTMGRIDLCKNLVNNLQLALGKEHDLNQENELNDIRESIVIEEDEILGEYERDELFNNAFITKESDRVEQFEDDFEMEK